MKRHSLGVLLGVIALLWALQASAYEYNRGCATYSERPPAPHPCDYYWGHPAPLLPEKQWAQYVGRKSAFSPNNIDPASLPRLSGTGQVVRRSSTKRTAAAAPKPDPCAEKIYKAFDDAAKAGLIPASAVPPNPAAVVSSRTTTQTQTQVVSVAPRVNQPQPVYSQNTPGVPMTEPLPAPNLPRTPGGGIYSEQVSSVAAPGTSAHGISPTSRPQ